MKIKNSRLELEKLDDLSDVSKVMARKDLRYKTIYAIFPNKEFIKDACHSISFKGNYKIDPSEEAILKSFDEYYIITNSGTKDSKVTYTEDEKKIIISIISGLVSEFRLDTAELLCHALGNRELLQTFYSDYGKMLELKQSAYELIDSGKISTIKNVDKLFPYQYQRSRYSIYELVQDLVDSKADICLDTDLLGRFEKISRNLEKTSEFIGDSWNPITGKSFNKTRANINLTYIGTVKVDVPENEFGVKPGPRELKTLKSICLVKDGKVCNSSFGIKINSSRLARKLKAAGIVKDELVCSGEYLVDITNLPVISKSKLSNIRSFDLATAEVKYRLCDIAIEYLRRKSYMESRKLDKLPEKIDFTEKTTDPAELYLESLGIYGNYFYPDKKVGNVQRVYDTTELISNIRTIPTKETCTKNITKMLNGSTVRCNKFVYDFLTLCVIPEIKPGMTYKELIKIWETRKNSYRDIIRDLKFRLISGKSLRVCVHGSRIKSLLNTRETIKIPAMPSYEISITWALKDKHVIV